jgi:SAM-dependent methyltransferase
MANTNQNKQLFEEKVLQLVAENQNFKITFSKQRHQNKEVSNVYLKTTIIKNQIQYSATYRHPRRDEVKNYAAEQMEGLLDNFLGNLFYNAVLFTENEETTLLQSKKGKSTLFSKKLSQEIIINTSHDHQKSRLIPEKTTWLQDLGIAGKDGKILDKSQDKFRQINKFIEIIDHLLKDFNNDQLINIADMGCGKGYLTFALYDYLSNAKKLRCRVTGYDVNQDVVALCYNLAIKHGFVGLTFQQKDIHQVSLTATDMVIALHACDIATDMALAKGIKAGARYIVASPCCHKQVRNTMKYDNVLSPILKHGILEERQAEILTDGIRSLILESEGYKSQVFEFISSEHTSKNLMITAVKDTPNPKAKEQIDALKSFFNLEYHHLEKELSEN